MNKLLPFKIFPCFLKLGHASIQIGTALCCSFLLTTGLATAQTVTPRLDFDGTCSDTGDETRKFDLTGYACLGSATSGFTVEISARQNGSSTLTTLGTAQLGLPNRNNLGVNVCGANSGWKFTIPNDFLGETGAISITAALRRNSDNQIMTTTSYGTYCPIPIFTPPGQPPFMQQLTPNGCVKVATQMSSAGVASVTGYTLVLGYTNPNSFLVPAPISIRSIPNFMYLACDRRPFSLAADVRVARNLRQSPTDPSSPYVGTRFLPNSSLNEVSFDVGTTPACVTWCLQKTPGSGDCFTLSPDATLSTVKDNSRFCPESRITAEIGEPVYRCDMASSPNIVADVSALISGAANPTWKIECPPGSNVAVDTSGGRTAHLTAPVSALPVSCTVELSAANGPISTVAAKKIVTLSSEKLGTVVCAQEKPVDLCGISGGGSTCLDCKGVPYGSAINVGTCGCIDSKNSSAVLSCSSCTQTDLSKIQGSVDSQLKDMENVIKKLINADAALTGKPAASHLRDIRVEAHNQQIAGWTVVWTKIESSVYACPANNSPEVCTVIPPSEQAKALGTIRCNADNLLALGNKVKSLLVASLKKDGGKSSARSNAEKALRVQGKKLMQIYNSELEAIAKLPNTYVSCSRQNATVTIQANLACSPLP